MNCSDLIDISFVLKLVWLIIFFLLPSDDFVVAMNP